MNQQYFVVELGQPADGQAKRIQISYKSIFWVAGTIFVLFVGMFLAGSSYLRMFWKVSHYNQLRADFDRLRGRYQNLQQAQKRSTEEMASLETLATEVSVAYGISQPVSADLKPMDEDGLSAGNAKESIEEFNFLKAASFSRIFHHYAHQFQAHVQPNLWPVNGTLRSSSAAGATPSRAKAHFTLAWTFRHRLARPFTLPRTEWWRLRA